MNRLVRCDASSTVILSSLPFLLFFAVVCRYVNLYVHVCTPWTIKSQLNFVCNFVKYQGILVPLSLLDLQMNVTCDDINFNHLT